MTTLGRNSEIRTPTGMKVAPQSYRTLEAAADQLRPLLPTVGSNSFMIDGWRLLEKTLRQAGYESHIEDEKDLQDCAAFAMPDRKLVVLREDIYDGLFTDSAFARSTVVHELTHIVLNHHVTCHRGAELGKHRFYEDSEWQAKAMTAAVMMPLEACKAVTSAEQLAAMCGTSNQAARYRLERLEKDGLIEPKGLFW